MTGLVDPAFVAARVIVTADCEPDDPAVATLTATCAQEVAAGRLSAPISVGVVCGARVIAVALEAVTA